MKRKEYEIQKTDTDLLYVQTKVIIQLHVDELFHNSLITFFCEHLTQHSVQVLGISLSIYNKHRRELPQRSKGVNTQGWSALAPVSLQACATSEAFTALEATSQRGREWDSRLLPLLTSRLTLSESLHYLNFSFLHRKGGNCSQVLSQSESWEGKRSRV